MNDRKAKIIALRIVRRWRGKHLSGVRIYRDSYVPNVQQQTYLIGYKGATFFDGPLIYTGT